MTLNSFLTSKISSGDQSLTLTVIETGASYSAWSEVSISRSLNQVSATFSISMIDKWRDGRLAYEFKPGVKISIKLGRDPILIGFIDALDVSVSNDDRTLSITGRDLTGDLVDSSAPTTPSEFKNITIESLARKLCAPYQIGIVSPLTPTKPFDKFSVKQGESVFAVLERAAKARGILLLSRFDGMLELKLPAYRSQPSAGTLAAGVNVVTADATYSETERFQKYRVISQTNSTGARRGKKATEIEATATDQGVARTREKTIIAEAALDVAGCQARANWEASVRAARSIDASVSVQGWRTQLGKLWDVGQIVSVDIGFIGIEAKTMLVSSIDYQKNLSSGTTATLGLTRVDAYESSENLQTGLEQDLGWSPSPFKNLDLF